MVGDGLEREARVPACKGAANRNQGWSQSVGDWESLKVVHQENGAIKCTFRQLVLMTVWKAVKDMEIGRPALKSLPVRG